MISRFSHVPFFILMLHIKFNRQCLLNCHSRIIVKCIHLPRFLTEHVISG